MIKRRLTSTQKHTNKYFMKRPKPTIYYVGIWQMREKRRVASPILPGEQASSGIKSCLDFTTLFTDSVNFCPLSQMCTSSANYCVSLAKTMSYYNIHRYPFHVSYVYLSGEHVVAIYWPQRRHTKLPAVNIHLNFFNHINHSCTAPH